MFSAWKQQNCFEKEFESLFESSRRSEMAPDDIRDILKSAIADKSDRKSQPKRLFLYIAILFAVIGFLSMEFLPEFSAAVGRLLLIKMLPLWDWTSLYTNSNCVIDRVSKKVEQPFSPSSENLQIDAANCLLCRTLDGITATAATNFSYIEKKYLERGAPVIVTNSNDSDVVTLAQFVELVSNTTTRDFIDSEPCDLATNLMLRKLFTVESALQRIQSLHPSDKWFLQLRNCRFGAVKASRRFITRPSFYPLHLKPFYSSWLLMAHNYDGLEQDIELFGLILVQQISGFFDYCLRPKRPCERSCPAVNIRLLAGESLIFSTDIWTLTYRSPGPDGSRTPASVATILEIEWSL